MKRLALLLAALPATAGAADEDKRARDVGSAWLIVPEAAPTDPVEIHKGELAVKARLLPIGYATLASDALDADGGKPLAPAGTPLMQLQSRGGIVECVIGEPPKTGLGNFWAGFKGGDSRVCFRDGDRDGIFEEFVRYKGLVQGLPSINGRLPRALHALSRPVSYAMADPRSMQARYTLGIRYDGHALLGGNPVFVDAFGQEGDMGTLNRAWPRGADGKGGVQHTGKVELDGVVLNVSADTGDHLTLTVERNFQTGVFGVSQTGGNIFY